MHILISNDDGYLAPGLAVLHKYLSREVKVTVVAPDRDRSGASNSLTLDRPLLPHNAENGFIFINGTPTDCVHIAITALLENDPPDMVVAGINTGANMGDDILYSGTVAAATEGRFLGLPAIAISQASHTPKYYETAGQVALDLILGMQRNPLPGDTILNVNVPDVPYGQLKGMAVTRLGKRHKAEPAVESIDPRNRRVYWLGPVGAEADAGPGTDFYAITQRQVSLTPLKIDLTDYSRQETLNDWLNKSGMNKSELL